MNKDKKEKIIKKLGRRIKSFNKDMEKLISKLVTEMILKRNEKN